VLVVALIAWRWGALLLATVSPDLSWASGGNPDRETRVLTFALAIVVAVALKAVGALLIGAMLIIPAAAARSFARTPEQMVAGAAALGMLASALGLWGAWEWDTRAGPSIVCAAAALFGLSIALRHLRRG
jgi:zinc transport system permease protein